jgi:acyl-CoA synthetase (AMP-forming)/AMP-acid ligase II
VVAAVGDGAVYSESNLVPKLNAGGSFTFQNVTMTGGNMVLRVKSINVNGNANVYIGPAPCFSNADCISTWTCNLSTGECIAPCSGTFAVSITPDRYPAETSWDLKQNSRRFASGDAAGMSSTCTIYDAYGDGICCRYGQGSYSVRWNDNVFGTEAQFTNSQNHTFTVTPDL